MLVRGLQDVPFPFLDHVASYLGLVALFLALEDQVASSFLVGLEGQGVLEEVA